RRHPDARHVAADRMERLGVLGLRSGEAREVELPRLRLPRLGIEVLEVLAPLERSERLLRLLLRQLRRLLAAQLLQGDLLAHFLERLLALRLLLLRLEHVEPGPVLEQGGYLAWRELQRLVLERLAVGGGAAGDEAQVAARLLGGVVALLLRHRGEVLA